MSYLEIVITHHLEIVMPILLLALSFVLKLVVGRNAESLDIISSLLELPVDMIFLSTVLIVGFTLSPSGDARQGLAWFSLYILGAIIVILLWRKSIRKSDKGSYISACCLGGLNYLLSTGALMHSLEITVQSTPV